MKNLLDGLRAILLDAGNTLVGLDFPALAQLLTDLGYPATAEDLVRAEYGGRAAVNKQILEGVEIRDVDRAPLYFGAILKRCRIPEDQISTVLDAFRAADKRFGLWRIVPPGTHEMLRSFKERGFKIGVISNADGRVAQLLERLELLPLLDIAIDSNRVGIEKPDPRIFKLALDQVGVDPHEAVYVGDIYAIDVLGARRAGLKSILIDPLMLEDVDCPRIRSVTELPHLLSPIPF